MLEISFSKLTNDQLLALSMDVGNLLSNISASELGITMYTDSFFNNQESYKKSITKGHVDADVVAQADSIRDNYSRGFILYIKSFLFHPDEAKKKAAKGIMDIINNIGRIFYREGYNVQSAKMEKLFQLIDETQIDNLALLQANEWYGFLKTSQHTFVDTMQQYTSDKAALSKIEAATNNRAALIESLRKLFAFLPLQAEITGNETLAKTIDQLQEIVNRY